MENNIYALRADKDIDIFSSLKQGEGRFGWSYIETGDLRKLKAKIDEHGWDRLDDDEKNCYQGFLLEFKANDYVVYINVPEYGKCTVATVTGPYQWRFEDEDSNHRFPVDPASIYVFDRNDASVHPALSTRLKLQGRYWRIYTEKEFEELLEVLTSGTPASARTPKTNYQILLNAIQQPLLEINRCIHHTHPNYNLEELFVEVFKKVPNVIDVKLQGGAGDHGADIIVRFNEGLPMAGLSKQSVLVVQVKSYEGDHWDPQAVNDIRRAFDHYPEASMGLIISTADAITEAVENELEKLRKECDKPVGILIGSDVASFLLKYGSKLFD